MDAADDEKNEDERARKSFDEDVGDTREEPVESKRRHHTGLIPPHEKGAVGRLGLDFVFSLEKQSNPPRSMSSLLGES